MTEQNSFCEGYDKNKNIQFFNEKLDLLWVCWILSRGSPQATSLSPQSLHKSHRQVGLFIFMKFRRKLVF